jgi:hypothetical protein
MWRKENAGKDVGHSTNRKTAPELIASENTQLSTAIEFQSGQQGDIHDKTKRSAI